MTISSLQLRILMYRMAYLVYYHWGCTTIHLPLSYPFKSLHLTPFFLLLCCLHLPLLNFFTTYLICVCVLNPFDGFSMVSLTSAPVNFWYFLWYLSKPTRSTYFLCHCPFLWLILLDTSFLLPPFLQSFKSHSLLTKWVEDSSIRIC